MKIIPAEKNVLEGLLHAKLPVGNSGDSLARRINTLFPVYDKSLVIGGLHRIKYLDFQHDREPLALILGHIPSLRAVLGFNFHYLTRAQGTPVIKTLARMNQTRIIGKKGPLVSVELMERMPLSFKPYRLYKIAAIEPLSYVPFDSWVPVIQQERNKWQGFRDFGDSRLQRKKNPNQLNENNKTTRVRNRKPKGNKPNLGTNRR
jgi:hypothetical protein